MNDSEIKFITIEQIHSEEYFAKTIRDLEERDRLEDMKTKIIKDGSIVFKKIPKFNVIRERFRDLHEL